jgi:hypothetical protein
VSFVALGLQGTVAEPDTAGAAGAALPEPAGAALAGAALEAATEAPELAAALAAALGAAAAAELAGLLAPDDELLQAATVANASTPAVSATPRRTPARLPPAAVPAEPRVIFIGTSCFLSNGLGRAAGRVGSSNPPD